MLIDNISKSISQLSDEELYDHIKSLRKARRKTTPIPKGKKTPAKASPKSKLLAGVDGMSEEELENLISQLEADL